MKLLNLTLIIITTLTLLSFGTFAQNPVKVSLTMGSAIPLAEFKSSDNSKLDAGFSNKGFILNIDADYYLHNRLCLSGRFHFGMSDIADKPAFNWMKSNLGNNFFEDSIKTNYGFWQWSAPLLGAKFNYPLIINKLYIETGLFSGFAITQIPILYIELNDIDTARKIFSQNITKSVYSMPFMADLSLRLILNDRIQLKIQSSYFQTATNHQHTSYFSNLNTPKINNEIKTVNLKVPIKTINLSAGLVYTL